MVVDFLQPAATLGRPPWLRSPYFLDEAALVVALTRSTSSQSAATSVAPSYIPEQTAAAHQKLCDTYKLAVREVQSTQTATVERWPELRAQMRQ